MKKIISVLLSSVMLLSILSCFAVSAAEVPYPPLETGHYGASIYFKPYSFETTDNKSISFEDACMLQVDKFNNPAALHDESLENQIKDDYIANVDNDADVKKMEINYYGTLSDGSMLVFVDCKYYYECVVDYKVIGKYVYYTPTKDETIVVYKNHEFIEIIEAYQDGTLTDELLDETAEILCFAKFAEQVKYPPLETGHYGGIDTEKYPVEYPDRKREKLALDELNETQIKEDYYKLYPEADYSSITVDYYGTLSDGSMLVFVESDMSVYLDAVDYMVIGKCLYVTSSIGEDIRIYRNNTFTSIINAYKDGSLSDELLDETADILCFAKFVNPNEEPETPVLYGDVDNDGVITVLDATLVQKLGLGIEEPESELTSVLADVNNDGRISVLDVTCIQKYIAGGYGNTGRTGIEPLVVG